MSDEDQVVWKPIHNDRVMYEHPDGFTIIKPAGKDPTVPFKCPLCDLMMRLIGDPESYRKHGACSDCASRWAEGPNAERWKEGWRPNPDEVATIASSRRR